MLVFNGNEWEGGRSKKIYRIIEHIALYLSKEENKQKKKQPAKSLRPTDTAVSEERSR